MTLIILQSASAQWINPIIMLGMVVVFWLFFIRPQAQKAKAEEQFVEELQKGKEVVLKSGLIGRVNKIEGKIITLSVDTKTNVRVMRTAISKELTDSLSNNDTSES